MNAHSIGIEVISNGTDFTEAQVIALAELVKYLKEKYGIDPGNIIRHKDYSTRKWDIGDAFYKVAGSDTYEKWIDEKILGKTFISKPIEGNRYYHLLEKAIRGGYETIFNDHFEKADVNA